LDREKGWFPWLHGFHLTFQVAGSLLSELTSGHINDGAGKERVKTPVSLKGWQVKLGLPLHCRALQHQRLSS
jgi:hypothetical protein